MDVEVNSMRAFLVGVGLLMLLGVVAIAGQTRVPTPQRLPEGWRN